MRIAAVLALLWGNPPRILVVRKSCRLESYWSCDIALPGGHVERGESLVEAALREAWEEAWIHPSMVEVEGLLPPEKTLVGGRLIYPVLARPKGPLCPKPASSEVDAVLWIPLSIAGTPTVKVKHPKRGLTVEGYRLAGGVLWGATLRILRRLYSLQASKTVDP